MNIVKKLFDYIKLFFQSKCGKWIASILGAIGIGVGAKGAVDHSKAKKINKKALKIKEEAVLAHDKAIKETETVLDGLGNKKTEIIKHFDDFANLIEKIQNRPDFFAINVKKYRLPQISETDLKKLSEDLEFALMGVGAMAGGFFAGLACGLNVLAAGPGFLAVGVVWYIDGKKVKEKAAENVKQAKQIQKDVDKILAYYKELSEISLKMEKALNDLSELFYAHTDTMKRIVSEKRYWNDYSKKERKVVENTVRLCELLYKMCQTELYVTENDVKKANHSETNDIIKESEKYITKIRKKDLLSRAS